MRFGLMTYAEQRRMGDFISDAEAAAKKAVDAANQAGRVIGDASGGGGPSVPSHNTQRQTQQPTDSGGSGFSGSTILLGGLGLAGALLWWKRR